VLQANQPSLFLGCWNFLRRIQRGADGKQGRVPPAERPLSATPSVENGESPSVSPPLHSPLGEGKKEAAAFI